MVKWHKDMRPIDFSCKHEILIEDMDGTLRPMDEPYYHAEKLAEDTWQILSDGDYSYLVAGSREALLIDTGYACGNIREFCQTLVGDRPLSKVANTHGHFDHTANNYLFDRAYMSAEAAAVRCRPNPSFYGLEYPDDYPVEIIDEGYVFHLGERDIEVYRFSDHFSGSLAYLDKKTGIFFSGDELVAENYRCRYSLKHSYEMIRKFKGLQCCYNRLCAGPGIFPAGLVDEYLEAFEYLLKNMEEGRAQLPEFPPAPVPDGKHRVVYKRRFARPCDLGKHPDPDFAYKRELVYKNRRIEYWLNKL